MATTLVRDHLALPSDREASGRSLGQEEMANLAEVIASGVLSSTQGKFVKRLEQQFADLLSVKHVYACSSGTAAIHAAVAAVDPEPGDEIVTSPITDMGALTPILYQGAIPVFAEVDPETWNVTAETIGPCLSTRTKAIIATHLFGNPCQMDEIMDLADSRRIPVIEDCAQAFLAQHRDRFVGTIGKIGCFSLQQSKHITAGEGGLIATNDDLLARRLHLFINKGWGYGDAKPDHDFLALNYRMSELQGAVALAQLSKLEQGVRNRVTAALALSAELANLPGVETPHVSPDTVHAYWKYCLRINSELIPGGAVALAEELKARQISCVPRYIEKPAFMCRIFQEQKTFGSSRFPFTLARPGIVRYDPTLFPTTMKALNEVLVLPWNDNYRKEHVAYMAASIRETVFELCR